MFGGKPFSKAEFFFSTVATLSMMTGSVASAQGRYCTPHKEMVAQLEDKYQEKQYGSGAVGQVAVMEVFVAESGTWTVVVTDVTGKSCILAAGDAWEVSPQQASETAAPISH